ncbi:2OG-Fe(II) oxygenase [Comamonas antarctica]|uniref:2OG-Fe(II) oxygenase n=1 Tax=Comamonas antarctica TaxID=2743470 RepID=A0A6N1X6Y1_9BURK|nr:2OG-Fe(II) oxygenase [Comamonas antarctica]QKV54063.1 2OG-Fe(II) oxygenase [Comamonas antarctica]
MSRSTSSPSTTQNPAGATPELHQWIDQQRSLGVQDGALFTSMVAAGWDEGVACQALDPAPAASTPTAALPEPDLGGEPGSIDVGDRAVRVLMSMNAPRVVLFGEILSADECEALIEAAKPRLARSLTVETASGGEEINADRTSDGMFFQRGELPLVQQLEERIARLLNWPVENGEGLQVLRYGPGAEYKPHHDYFDPHEPGTASIVRRGGQRVGTLIIYLNEPAQGGATTFPEAGLQVVPQRGHAVFFSYAQPDPATRTLHGGAPVIRGQKWIATKWLRQGRFD